ncbi:GMC oxidoreductase [Streptomyces sp. NPDC000594]|uniref:GMC family oxidoreductase n=1 Tax=Streptomyces sp. NPDC000594 TaxID=3154261 RepID=UPI00331C9271
MNGPLGAARVTAAQEALYCEREVVLCAGVYNSPQLLMLSGIGIADEPAAHGIEPRADLPVGESLQDHLHLSVIHLTGTGTGPLPGAAGPLAPRGRGLHTSDVGGVGGFARTREGLDAPDIQFHAMPMVLPQGPGTTTPALVNGAALLGTTSRGKVSLRSAQPGAKPRVLHNYLAIPEDRETALRALRAVLRIAYRPALRVHRRADHLVPDSDGDGDLLTFARREANTLYHPVGTCALGTFVDRELRVHGVSGLRVADASVMPTLVRGNTNAAAIMIGEKAADLIRSQRHDVTTSRRRATAGRRTGRPARSRPGGAAG